MALVRINPPIVIDEITIREFTLDDVDQYHAAILKNREYLVPWVSDWIKSEPISLTARIENLKNWISTYETKNNPTGIFIAEKLVGSAGLHDRNEPGAVEIGYWVDQELQGKGIATRAARALTEFALSKPNVNRVLLFHKIGNEKSYRVAEKLGFTLVQTVEKCGGDAALLWTKTK